MDLWHPDTFPNDVLYEILVLTPLGDFRALARTSTTGRARLKQLASRLLRNHPAVPHVAQTDGTLERLLNLAAFTDVAPDHEFLHTVPASAFDPDGDLIKECCACYYFCRRIVQSSLPTTEVDFLRSCLGDMPQRLKEKLKAVGVSTCPDDDWISFWMHLFQNKGYGPPVHSAAILCALEVTTGSTHTSVLALACKHAPEVLGTIWQRVEHMTDLDAIRPWLQLLQYMLRVMEGTDAAPQHLQTVKRFARTLVGKQGTVSESALLSVLSTIFAVTSGAFELRDFAPLLKLTFSRKAPPIALIEMIYAETRRPVLTMADMNDILVLYEGLAEQSDHAVVVSEMQYLTASMLRSSASTEYFQTELCLCVCKLIKHPTVATSFTHWWFRQMNADADNVD